MAALVDRRWAACSARADAMEERPKHFESARKRITREKANPHQSLTRNYDRKRKKLR